MLAPNSAKATLNAITLQYANKRLLRTGSVVIQVEDPSSRTARACLARYSLVRESPLTKVAPFAGFRYR